MAVSKDSCTLCLLKGLSDRQYERLIEGYIEKMDPELRVSDEILEKRVQICRACKYIQNGMCRLCGCFIALRTIKKENRCADSPEKW